MMSASRNQKRLPVRALAAQVLMEVADRGHSLSDVLPRSLPGLIRSQDAALLQEICYGAARWFFRLQAILDLLLQKPLKSRDREVYFLLLSGLYQLIYMKIPPHAIVKETVDATRVLNRKWAAGLVNAILRSFQREQEALLNKVDRSVPAASSHPEWLIRRLKTDWPEHWQQVLEANNRRAPMALRVNLLRTNRQNYLERLQQEGIQADVSAHVDSGIILKHPVNVDELPGFRDGLVSVQDTAAQLAAVLLSAGPGMRVLDACAAPGGKTLSILERVNGLEELVALDVDEQRLGRVQENLDRAGLTATVRQGDAAQPDTWWYGKPFDRILLDAPCSATGVIRRHPDIKLLRRSKDIESLAEKQAKILSALWPLLVSGGKLVYATCSVLKQENAEQIQRFLECHGDAKEEMIEADWGFSTHPGRQVLPGEDQMDGFYYACLRKT